MCNQSSRFPSFLLIAVLGAVHATALSQTIVPSSHPQVETLDLNFPSGIELRTLIDLVGQRTATNITYEDQSVNQKVTIRLGQPIPKESLIGLLENVLKMKGLALVDGEQPGWKRVVIASNLSAFSRPATQPSSRSLRGGEVISEAFRLRNMDAQKADTVIKSFLTQPGGSSIALPDQQTLITTDYASNIQRISDLLQMLDQQRADVLIETIPARHVDPSELAQQVSQLLQAKLRVQGDTGNGMLGVEVTANPRANAIIVVGGEESGSGKKAGQGSIRDIALTSGRVYVGLHAEAEAANSGGKDEPWLFA